MTQARESLGLTKVALATLVNVSGPTITNWESGKQNPEEEKLRALSTALNQPVHWFLREKPPSCQTPYFYRSLSAATKVAREATRTKLDWMAELSLVFNQWLQWPMVRVPVSTKHFLSLSDEDIELLALQFRERLNLGTGPIKDIVLAAENAGIICARGEVGHNKMDGVSHWHQYSERPYIFLASDKGNGVRSRFDTAHEIGHVVLHKDVNLSEHNQTYIKEIERQADLFAGALLLPAETFAKELGRPTLETFLALKPRWKVSIAAMIYRAWQLDIISDLQKSNLYKRLSAKRWRIKEPYDDEVPFEKPRLLPRAVYMLVDQGLFTKETLLDKLGLSAGVCETLCSLPAGYFRDIPLEDNLVTLRVAGGGRPRQPSTQQAGKVVKVNDWSQK